MARNSELPILDPATLEQLQELIDGNDTSFLIDMLRGEVDQEVLRRAAHTLKGSSLNVGASRVADLCKRLESQLRAEPPADMPAQVDQIENRVQQVHDSYSVAINQLAGVSR
jgi:histidine phosphotransfer protein HptB